MSDIIVHGTSLFLRGMRSLADFGHSVSCIAFRCGRARKFAPPQRTRGWNGTSAPSRTRRASKRDRGTVDGFWFLRVPLIVRHQHTAFNPGDPEMSAEVGKVQRADGARNYKEINLVRPGQQDDYIADRVIFKANQRSVTPGPPSLGWLFINCFQPAEWYSSFTELRAPGSYCQGSTKWYRWTETPLTPARRRSSLSASSLEAKTSMEWSSVNSVFEDAICRSASMP